MNLRVPLLVGSLALNAGLIAAFVTRPQLAPPVFRDYFGALRPAPPTPVAAVVRPSVAVTRAEGVPLWSRLRADDLPTLVARLRAAGFPPVMVRAIVDAEIERQFAPRFKELTRILNDTPYWKPENNLNMGSSKLFEDIGQIYRERARVIRELLGKDAYAWGGSDPTEAQRRQFGNLSSAKIDLVQRITEDYAEMAGQLRVAMQGITLPEDREKLALLEREKHADLAAVLTPEELADYELRTSMLTMRLRTTLTIMDASEAEFRALYGIIDPFKDVLYPTIVSGSGIIFLSSDNTKRGDAMKQVNDQAKAALGDARFAEYQRASDSEFQQLYRLGQRDRVPYETLVRAYDLRTTTMDSATKIFDDATLTSDAKRAALKNLSQTARGQLLSTLGPASGPSYVDNARWISYLDQGRVVMTRPDGSTTLRSLPTTAAIPPR